MAGTSQIRLWVDLFLVSVLVGSAFSIDAQTGDSTRGVQEKQSKVNKAKTRNKKTKEIKGNKKKNRKSRPGKKKVKPASVEINEATSISLFTETNGSRITFANSDTGAGLEYVDPGFTGQGLQVTYKGVSVSGLISPRKRSNREVEIGDESLDSEHSSFSLSTSLRKKLLVQLFWLSHKGYKKDEVSKVDAARSDQVAENRSDISNDSFSLSLQHFYSPEDLKIQTLFFKGYLQKRSGGSFYSQVNVDRSSLEADQSFIPDVLGDEFGPWKQLNGLQIQMISAGGGYAHTWVWGNFNVSIGLDLGLGVQTVFLRYVDGKTETETGFSALARNGVRLGGQYAAANGVFLGFNGVAATAAYKENEMEFTNSLQTVSVFLGYIF